MTLSDALTHRDEPSAVLDTMSHVDRREMNVPRATRTGIFIRETRGNGWERMSVCVCEREKEREGGRRARERSLSTLSCVLPRSQKSIRAV